jgi:hypothetical protein
MVFTNENSENEQKQIGFTLYSNTINIYMMNKWQFYKVSPEIYTNYGDIAFYPKRKYMIAYRREQDGINVLVLFQMKIGINYDLTRYPPEYSQKYIDCMFMHTVAQAVRHNRSTVGVYETVKKYVLAGANIYTENSWAINTCKAYKKNNIINMIFMYKNIIGKKTVLTRERKPWRPRFVAYNHENPSEKSIELIEKKVPVKILPKKEEKNEKEIPLEKEKDNLFEWTIITDEDIISGDIPDYDDCEKFNEKPRDNPEKGFLEVPPIEKIVETLGKEETSEKEENPENHCINFTSVEKYNTVDSHAKNCNFCVLKHFAKTFKMMKEQSEFYEYCRANDEPLVNIIHDNINDPKKISDIMAINYYPINEVEMALEYIQKAKIPMREIYEIVKEYTMILI